MSRMKAMQFVEAGRAEIVEVPRPDPTKGEVLIRILGVATCPHWDLHISAGKSMIPGGTIEYPYPVGQPGHEAMGEIVSVGPAVREFEVGDRVALWRDQGPGHQGCYAEYVTASTDNILSVPQNFEPEDIASLELAMCIQVSFDQLREISTIEGKRIAVSGLGPAGLLAVQLARAYGAARVIGFDPLKSRCELAKALGADAVLDSTKEGAYPHDRFSSEALDLAIDCTGLSSSVEFLMDRTREAVVLFGVLREEVRFGFKHWCRALHLVGYGSHNRLAAQRALDHIVAGRLNLRQLITKTLPLREYAQGVDLLRDKRAIKVCFIP